MKFEYEPGDKVALKKETTFYTERFDMGITLPAGTVLEVFSCGQSGISEPFYNLEMNHHIHGDIDVNLTVSDASELLEIRERFE